MNDQEKFEQLWAELQAVSPFGPNASNQRAKELLEEVLKLPRAHNHAPWCNCNACQAIRKKVGSINYSVRVPTATYNALKKLGAQEVAKRLTAMIQ